MHALLVNVTIDSGHEKDARTYLETNVVPRVKEAPGIVSGHWMESADGRHGTSVILFESEEKARAREQDQRRQDGLEAARATMAEIFDGPPEFVDLTVVNDMVPG